MTSLEKYSYFSTSTGELKNKIQVVKDSNAKHSDRKKRELMRKVGQIKYRRSSLYNENGIHIPSGKDLCDCLDEDCPGCFMPCPECASLKCGHKCRNNRDSSYDKYHVEGLDIEVLNKGKEYERATERSEREKAK